MKRSMPRTRMPRKADCHFMSSSQGRERNTNAHVSSRVIENEEDWEMVSAEDVSEEDEKIVSPLEEARPIRQRKLKHNGNVRFKKQKHDNAIERWSAERYNQAEQHLLDVMRDEGAVFGKPISRPNLRMAGRKHIGDTGLLDHLLRHIDGKVAPGGTERFRRWFNPSGVMEYWLESADLDNVRREAGVQDPYWQPPSCHESSSSSDIKLVKEEMFNIKREMAELASKRNEQDEAISRMLKEHIAWKAKIDQRYIEISTSLQGLQAMYQDLSTWKPKIESQMMEVCNMINDMHSTPSVAYSDPVVNPNPEKWEEWLVNSNLEEDMQGNDITTMFMKTDPICTEWGGYPHSSPSTGLKASEATNAEYAASANGLAMFKEDASIMKRDRNGNLLKKQENSVPDWNMEASSVNGNWQPDFKNASVLFPVMTERLITFSLNILYISAGSLFDDYIYDVSLGS
ncbi:hypothetical protein SAY86_009129 [Trapa natans]|uniref:PTC1-like winged helix-turn-helix domain-containing protein n=1 Tax=Trapa natans TaxID=22666 RepID=A0AAN7KAS1_TRANT|nr:hypothetical protein SAY86_009129 [Trapa natans]